MVILLKICKNIIFCIYLIFFQTTYLLCSEKDLRTQLFIHTLIFRLVPTFFSLVFTLICVFIHESFICSLSSNSFDVCNVFFLSPLLFVFLSILSLYSTGVAIKVTMIRIVSAVRTLIRQMKKKLLFALVRAFPDDTEVHLGIVIL